MGLGLQDQVALVTGASRGLGLAIARQLAGAGAAVALVARDENNLRDVLRTSGIQRGRAYGCDLADEMKVDALIQTVLNDFQRVDILVNNAAVQGPIGSVEQVAPSSWKDVFAVNLFAPVRLSRACIASMRARGRGKIVNISGGGATSARASFAAYGASKCALVRFTETLALELKGTGIDVNSVAPGAMNTRMLEEVLEAGAGAAPGEYAQAEARARQGGMPPETAAELVTFLASPASDGITGRLISAQWDAWRTLANDRASLNEPDAYTLRRVAPRSG